MGASHHHCGGLLQLYMGNHNTSHLILQPANSSLLVQLGQGDSGRAKHLIVPPQQITSQQALIKNTQANSNPRHIQLQHRRQQKGHAGCAHYLDESAISTRDICGHLFLYGQTMGIHPLLYQKSDGRPCVDHHQALSGLTSRLITPHNLPWHNTKEEI